MNDRELLKAAAKAAGVPLRWPHDPATYERVDGVPPRRTDTWESWSPLTDDGDALRLAVKLRIDLSIWPEKACVQSVGGVLLEHPIFENGDPYAATRRAIVRAAAAIAQATNPAEPVRRI